MSTADLTLWFNEVLWPCYAELVKTPFATKYRAGSKGESLKKIITMKPSGELQDRIRMAITEQRKHRKKLYEQAGSMNEYLRLVKFEKFYLNRMCVTWINQMGWEDEIPTLADVVNDRVTLFDGALCRHSGCPNIIHGPSYIHCAEHESRTEESNEMLKQKLRDIGMTKNKDESVHDYAMRCKDKAKKLMRGLTDGMRM